MIKISKKTHMSLYVGIGFLLIVIFAELLAILILNNGKFVYTLDDPYIHLALAENIAKMHYGVNINEFSAPSSSILWPFLLTPFSSIEISPLLLNIIFACLTVYVYYRLLCISFSASDNVSNLITMSLLLILLILTTNLVGLVFTGMEHSMQVLFISVVAYGLCKETKINKLETWLVFAIVIAPLIRYENIAISTAAIIFLVIRKYYKSSLTIGILIVLLVGSFSLFLSSLGLGILPTSVFAKSNIVNGHFYASLYSNLENTLLFERQGAILLIGTLGMLVYLLFGTSIEKRLLAASTMFACFAYFLAGRWPWRYPIFIWTFFLLIFLYLAAPQIKIILDMAHWKKNLAKLSIAMIAFVVVSTPKYIYDLKDLPIASNNIYEQQYQMHRFALMYNKPVAVNDLGYVSYKNNNYVLDLWGLASEAALEYRKRNNDVDWMQELCKKNDVELVMIYNSWFSNSIPANWIKIGELYLGKQIISSGDKTVSFYATNQQAYTNAMRNIRVFIKTLPSDVKFVKNP